MKTISHCLRIFPLFLLVFCWHTDAYAQGGVAVLDSSVRVVSSTSSGRFFKLAWSVKLRNQTNEEQTCTVLVSFLDADENQISKATKTQVLKPRESKNVRDTVRLRSSVVNQIASTNVSVTLE